MCVPPPVDLTEVICVVPNYSDSGRIRPFRGRQVDATHGGWCGRALALAVCCLFLIISGCGATLNETSSNLVVSPGTIDFGTVPVGQTAKSTVSLSNQGVLPVSVSQLAVDGQTFSVSAGGSLPVTIAPGSSYSFNVGFQPAATTSYSGKFSAIDSTAKTVAQAQVSGNGVSVSAASTSTNAPALAVSTSNLNFGNVTVGSSVTQSVTFTSTGTAPLVINSAVLNGAEFSAPSASLPITLNPNQAISGQITFKPTSAGAASGTLTIGSNSSSGATVVVNLSGTGTSASTETNSGAPSLAVSTSNLNFGNVLVGSSVTQGVTFTSTGTAPLVISSAALKGAEFSTPGGSLPVTLNPNQSITGQVTFKPTTTGPATGTLTIGSNSSNGATTVVNLSGNGAAASTSSSTPGVSTLAVSTSNLSFGDIALGANAKGSVTLTSTGTLPVTIASAALSGTGFTISSQQFPVTLNPAQSITLSVEFAPTVTGSATGSLTIRSTSSTGPTTTVGLSGTGTGKSTLAVSSSSLSFGNLALGANVTKTITLTSTGTSPVTISAAALSGSNAFVMSAPRFPVTLNPKQSVTLSVEFKPTAVGSAAASVAINSNSSTDATTSVALSGTGTGTATLAVSSLSLNFGNVTLGAKATQTVTLTSTGTGPVTVDSAALGGSNGFAMSSPRFPVTLNPKQSVALSVEFDPTAAGSATGSLTIRSTSSSSATAVVGLSGTGTGTSALSASATSLNFGNVAIGSSSTQSITLKSTGTSAVTITSSVLNGASFSVPGASLPVTLNPNQSITGQVTFTPTAVGAATGTLTFGSNSSGGATVISLSGTGTGSSALAVSTSSLSFGNVSLGSNATQTITLTSTGTGPVTINSAALGGSNAFMMSAPRFPVTLNPKQSVTLSVEFEPTAVGSATGSVTIGSNSSTGATTSVALSGAGAGSSALSVSTSSLSFGNVAVGSNTTQTVTLTSTGTSAVTLSTAALTDSAFTMSGTSWPVTLNPKQSVTLSVKFAPTATGSSAGSLMISSNASTGATTMISLSGSGTGTSTLAVSSSSLSFGDVEVGSNATLSVTLTSTGTTPITINAASLSGAGFADSGATFPVTLQPNQAVTLSVKFTPTSAGSETGSVVVSSNASSGASVTIGLSGTGTSVPHSVALTWAAPSSSPDPVAGYHIYRSVGGSSSFELLNAVGLQVSYADSTVTGGTSYAYYVKSFDADGNESAASNTYTVSVPTN